MVQNAEEKCMPEWAHPVVAVLGGTVTGDRIELAGRLLEVADTILIGGGPANTFLSVKGGRVGRSETAREKYSLAREILDRAAEKGVKIFLPVDVFAANEMSPHAKPSLEGAMALFEDKIAMDIGPRTTELFRSLILTAGTVVWSGPMGVFELDAFSSGTKAVMAAVAETRAEKFVCGGGSARAVRHFGCEEQFRHVLAEDASFPTYP